MKGTGAAALGGGGGGDPTVEVELGAGGQSELVGGEPVHERGGGVDVAAGEGGLVGGGVGVAGALTEPSQDVPDGVAVQHLFVVGVTASSDGSGGPGLRVG